MFKQRFATMMHVFASINFNDTLGKIKHIKNENKKKRSRRDQKWPIFSENFPPDGAEEQYNNITHATSVKKNTSEKKNTPRLFKPFLCHIKTYLIKFSYMQFLKTNGTWFTIVYGSILTENIQCSNLASSNPIPIFHVSNNLSISFSSMSFFLELFRPFPNF